MSFLSIIIASAGMALTSGTAVAGPDGGNCTLCPSQEKTTAAAESKCESEASACEETECDSKTECETMEAGSKLPMIDAALYASADWPTHNSGEALYAKDYQGKKLPVGFGNETWISEKVNLEGKVLVLDFWATWCPPCVAAMPMLNELQIANDDNLAVVAIGGQREDEETVRSFVEDHKESINNLYDAKQSVFMPFQSKFIPLVVVVSTDGVVRWIGNPGDDAFQQAVKKVIAVDPMIQAKS